MQYSFWGKVEHGAARGRELGFPTANMKLHTKVPEGIYISQVRIKRKNFKLAHGGASIASFSQEGSSFVFPAVTFIGNAETFGEKDYKAESYILDFSSQIYGQWITVKLLTKIRINKKFDSKESLIEQMKQDVLAARKFFYKIK